MQRSLLKDLEPLSKKLLTNLELTGRVYQSSLSLDIKNLGGHPY